VSGFDEWKFRKLSARAERLEVVDVVIRQMRAESHQTNGTRRVPVEPVLGKNLTVARCTVEFVMGRLGLAGLPGGPKYREIPKTSTSFDLVNRDFAFDWSSYRC
jgi:hypothetical protein